MENKIKVLPILCSLCLFACFSCSQEEEVEQMQPNNIKVVFECSKTSFSSSTRAKDDVSSWKANDVVYLCQTENNVGKYIKCTYNGKDWTADFSKAAVIIGTDYVNCYHFANVVSYGSSYVTLNEKSVAFVNWWNKCSFDGKTLTIKANLNLYSSRIRFKGNKGETVTVTGYPTYSSFYPTDCNLYYKTNGTYTLTVQSDGYTPYIYGFIDSSNTLKISFSGKTYEKTIKSSQLSNGESGYIVLSELKENLQNFTVTLERNDFGGDTCIDN